MTGQLTVFHAEFLDDTDYHGAEELCHYARVSLADVRSMVEEGILEPAGPSPEVWQFSFRDLKRTRIVSRLQQDLGVNLPGAAIIIELLERG